MTSRDQLKPLDEVITFPDEIRGAIDLQHAEEDPDDILDNFIVTDELEKHLVKILSGIPDDQGGTFWLQGEFGSGKSHVLASIYSLFRLHTPEAYEYLERDSLVSLGSPITEKDVLVIPFSLAGGGDVQESLHRNIIKQTKEAYLEATGNELPVSRDDRLIEAFENASLDKRAFFDYLEEKSGSTWDEEAWENTDKEMFVGAIRTWLREESISLEIDEDFRTSFELALDEILEEFDHIFYIVDEISEFLNRRGDEAKNDEDVLFSLADLKDEYPFTMVMAAQQSLEQNERVTSQRGKLIAEDRLHNLTLTRTKREFQEIAVNRVIKECKNERYVEEYYSYFADRFDWVDDTRIGDFKEIFPFTPQTLELANRASSFDNTNRTGIKALHSAVQHHAKEQTLITPDYLFDEFGAEYGDTTTNSLKTHHPQLYSNYQRTIEDYLPSIEDQEFAHNVIKVLFLNAISKRGITPHGVANSLMREVVEDPEGNVIYYEEILEDLTQVPYIVSNNGTYEFQVEEEITIQEDKNQKIGEKDKDDARDIFADVLGEYGLFQDVDQDKSLSVTWTKTNIKVDGELTIADLTGWKSVNTPDDFEDQRFWLYIQERPDPDARDDVEDLLDTADDERVVAWLPRDLTDRQVNKLQEYEALTGLVTDYERSDAPHASEKREMAASQLEDVETELPSIIKDCFRQGNAFSAELSDIDFTFQQSLENNVQEIVQDPLNRTYNENELTFPSNNVWEDKQTNKILEGIVKYGKITTSMDSRYESAANNFAQGLKITSQRNPQELDLSDNPYTDKIIELLKEETEDDDDDSLPIQRIHNELRTQPIGLSSRIIAIYVLSLVKESKLEATVTGNIIEGGVVSSTNIEDAQFTNNDLGKQIETIRTPTAPDNWTNIVNIADTVISEDVSRERKQENYNAVWTSLQDRFEDLSDDIDDRIDRYERLMSEVEEDPTLTSDLEDLKAVITADYNATSAGGNLEKVYDVVIDTCGSIDDFEDAVDTFDSLSVFLSDYETIVTRASQALQDWPDDSLNSYVQEVRDNLDFPKVIRNEVAAGNLQSAVEEFEDQYTKRYRQAHHDYYDKVEEVNTEIETRLSSDLFEALQDLNKVDYNFADNELASTLRQQLEDLDVGQPCNREVSSQLKGVNLTCSCGFELGDTFDKPDISSLKPDSYLERALSSLQDVLEEAEEDPSIEAEWLDDFLSADASEVASMSSHDRSELVGQIDEVIEELNTAVIDVHVSTEMFDEPVAPGELDGKIEQLQEAIQQEIDEKKQSVSAENIIARIHLEGEGSEEQVVKQEVSQ